MNSFDGVIIGFLNNYSQNSCTFDFLISRLLGLQLFKGGIIIAVLWFLWFTPGNGEVVKERRKTVLATFLGTFVGLLLAQLLAYILPFRLRPSHNPVLHFRLPFGASEETLTGWSAFPSDHAALFIGLVTGIFLVYRRLGIVSLVYVLLVVLIPRVYLGLHHPTDIFGGALIGVCCVLLANVKVIKNRSTDPLMEWSESHTGWFFGLFFLMSYQTVTLFDDIRRIGSFLFGQVKNLMCIWLG